MPNEKMLTIPAALLRDLIGDVEDYSISREFKPRETAWRQEVLAEARALLSAHPTEQAGAGQVVRFKRSAFRGGWTTFNVRDEDADEAERRLSSGQPEPRAEVTECVHGIDDGACKQCYHDATDTERLDWLMHRMSGKALRDIGVVYSECDPTATRAAIDAARSGVSHD